MWSEKNNAQYLQPGSYKYIFTWTPEDETQKPVSVETRINVIAFADVFEQLPKLKEGRQKVVFNGELFFSFVPEVSGTYQFNANRDFPCIIQELEEDGKLSINYTSGYGDSISAELEGGKQYVVCIYGETGLRGESLTIDRVPVVESVEIASWNPENLTFTEGNAVSFHSINVRLKTNKGSEIVRLYGYNGLYGNMTDAYGNTVGYALYKIENNDFVGLDFANMDSLPAGEYAFRVYYNNGNMTPGKDPDFIAENYVPVHIKSVQDQTKDSALDTEKPLTVKVENSRAIYSFTPKKTGRYELSTSTFVEGVLKDGDGKEIEKQNRHERSMYVSLAKDTTYYMYMKVPSSLCTQIQVSAEKLALPVEITVSLKKTSYAAELTQMWEVQPKFTIKYDDETSETATEDSIVSGWGLGYYLGNSQGDAIYSRMDYIPAGTWICAPELYTNERDEEILKDVLQVNTYGPEITAESQKIDISKLEEIKENVPVSVPETKQTFYKVVADADQSYKLEMPDGVTAKFYEWNETEGLKTINRDSVHIGTKTTYLIGVTAYRQSEITLKKTSGGVSGPQNFEGTYPLEDGFRQTIQMPEDKASPATLEFTFTPDEDASYCFQIESNLKTRVLLYEGERDIYGKNSDGDLKVSYYLNKGKTYTYQMVCNEMKAFDKVTVSFKKAGEYKSIKEMTYSLKDGMKATDLNVLTDFFDVYDVQIHYTDDSVLMLEYNWDGYAGTDAYGNFLMCEWDTNIENIEAAETECDISIEYRNAEDEKWTEKTVTVPMSGLAGMQNLKTGDSVYPFRNQGIYSAYTFTSEESGLYLLRAKTEDGEPSPQVQVYRYELNSHGGRPISIRRMMMDELEDNGYTVWLEKGENYLIGTGRDGVEYNRNTTLSVKKAKILQSVEIKKKPNQTALYPVESFSGVSLEGMVITAHYTDGTSEDIFYGQTDSNGTLFEMDIDSDDGHWISGKKFRQDLHFGDYSFYVDFDAAEVPDDIPVVKVDAKTNTYVEGKTLVPVKFTPEETGFYSVEMPNGGLSTAVDKETGERWVDTNYYFEKDRSYLIYVWADQKDAYVIIRRGACQWQMVTKTEPTCTEDAQYVMECKIHNHTYSYSSYYEEKGKAYGHAFSTWKVTKEATCASEGSEERTCARCKEVEKRTIPATGEHSYDSWKTTRESTVLNMGQQERICSVCKKKETKSIAKLKATISLNVSGTIPLKTKQTFTPKVTMGKGDKVVSWKSSNKKVASVDKNGKVKGLKAGKTATITVQLASGLKKSFKVKVQKKNVATKSLKVVDAATGKKVSSKVSLKRKQTLKLAATVSPITSKEKVKYSSSNKKVVSVSSKGVIKAKKKGKATITVKSGKKTYRIKVTVK